MPISSQIHASQYRIQAWFKWLALRNRAKPPDADSELNRQSPGSADYIVLEKDFCAASASDFP
ncbi:hypothetical protein L0128_22235 [candidate division KSB1 bacterium]|nr:hypothetical protein [candidate division KSB1 bacterium]